MKTYPTPNGSVLSELKKANATMLTLAEKFERTEKRMRNMEKRVKQSGNNLCGASSNNSSPSKFKKSVPMGIRVRLYS